MASEESTCEIDDEQEDISGKSNKRQFDDSESESTAKKHKSDDANSDLRLLITSKHGRVVIGKGGETIKRLRSEYGLKIIVPDCSGPERLVTIHGKLRSMCEMMLELIPLLNEDKSEDKLEIRIFIHQSQAGPLIGKGGSVISKLREETNAAFKVFEMCCPFSSDRIVQITGTSQTICNAITAIFETLDPFPPIGKVNPYDPINFDDVHSVQYGGYSDNRNINSRGYNRDGNSRARFSGNNRNDMFMDDYGMYGRSSSMENNPMRMRMMQNMYMREMSMREPPFRDWSMMEDSSYGGRFNRRNGYGMQNDFEYDHSEEKNIKIPGKAAGILLSKGGALVQKVRDSSGAGVKIINNKDRAAPCQVILTGAPQQIQKAEFLMKRYSV